MDSIYSNAHRRLREARLTPERLKEVLRYDLDTGLLTWLITKGSAAQAGQVVTGLSAGGYVRVGIDGMRHFAHRLAWLYVYGVWPSHHLDHIDGDKTNNRITNLREVNQAQNLQNVVRPKKNNKCGLLGVSWCEKDRKWIAQLSLNRQRVHTSWHDTKEEARAAYLEAKRRFHPFSTT